MRVRMESWMSRLAETEGRLPGEDEGIGSGSGRGREERKRGGERVGTTPCHPRAGLSQIKYPRLAEEGGEGVVRGEVCVYVAMPWSCATADACESCAGDMHLHRSYPACGYRDVRDAVEECSTRLGHRCSVLHRTQRRRSHIRGRRLAGCLFPSRFVRLQLQPVFLSPLADLCLIGDP